MRKDSDLLVSDAGKTSAELWKQLIKKAVPLCIALAVAILAVVAYFSRAWFANNREVEAQGMSVLCAGTDYELCVKGEAGMWDKVISSVPTGTPQEIQNEMYYVTGENSDIRWTVEGGSHFGNLANGDDVAPDGIKPGSSGSITFYILAKKEGPLSVNFNLQVQGLTDERTDVSADAGALVQGHILLFAGFENQAYKGWISDDADEWRIGTDDSTTLTRNNDGSLTWSGTVVENQTYPVTIYWIWPEVLGQYLFQDQSHIGDRPVLFPVDSGEGTSNPAALPSGLFGKMCDTSGDETSNRYFKWTGSPDMGQLKTDLEKRRNGNFNTLTYGDLCGYYDAADQYLGEVVRYLTLRLDTQ